MAYWVLYTWMASAHILACHDTIFTSAIHWVQIH